MKIVNISGGLGNQMFQYAFAIRLQKEFPTEPVYVNTSHYNHFFIKRIGATNLHNGYEIENIFQNADLLHARWYHLSRISWYIPNYWMSRVARKLLPCKKSEYIQRRIDAFKFLPEVFECEGDMYYEGNWESVQYLEPIRDDIIKIFTQPYPDAVNLRHINRMMAENSVGIHIRRGDYINHPDFSNICDLDYYRKGINEILKDGKKYVFFIFSNDISWCKEVLYPLISGNEVITVANNTGDKSYWDMFLMTYCKDLIIANSSFSWWGAFLNNRGGRVVAPKKWTNREAEHDIWLNEWIKL